MNIKQIYLPLALVAQLAIFSSSANAINPSNTPLYLNGSVDPNVMFILDDSGSMQWEVMPDYLVSGLGLACNNAVHAQMAFTFPRPNVLYGADYSAGYFNITSGSGCYNGVARFDDTNRYARYFRTAKYNPIYYNPAVRYLPWKNADGSSMANITATAAPLNPMNVAEGTRDLTVDNTHTAVWINDNATEFVGALTYYPATYFNYTGPVPLTGPLDANNTQANFSLVEIKPANAPFPKAATRTDCAGADCTYAEEIQNFANWFSYYRSRVLAARAGIGAGFAQQGTNMRVGFGAINKGSTSIDGANIGTIVRGVRPFSGADRTEFFNLLYNRAMPAGGTPLRKALDDAGQYFSRNSNAGPWGDTPGTNNGAALNTHLRCRQSYTILMTDGYWSGTNAYEATTAAARANNDGTAGPNNTGPGGASFNYAAVSPFTDNRSNTLADVAMYYWKNDLRADLANEVPSSSINPAFWQHMVTFGVGFGVTGSISPTDAFNAIANNAAIAWPDPDAGAANCTPGASCQARLDDLLHAAVNSRGDFFTTSDPDEFAKALSTQLQEIVNRTSSSSSVATSTTELKFGSKYFQSLSVSGEWSGRLVSRLISNNVLQWDSATQLATQITPNSDTRVIITRGANGGVPFQFNSLLGTQQDYLNKNGAGIVDGRGADRVGYLRGHSQHEGVAPNEFRTRPNSKIGDIVHSNPWYTGEPAAGHSDVDHPNYSTFRATNLTRMPVVYVGANDGMLHGFNACDVGTTYDGVLCTAAIAGKEVLAYVPSVVYPNLSKLMEQDYRNNHRYYVDGSPMVGDASFANNAWKSVLIGGMNSGGKAFFALDVTNPANFSEGNAASLLLWEFTEADDADLGLTYNLPPLNQENGQPYQIVKMANDKWAAIVGNGYNSSAGKSALFILFLDGPTGAGSTWTAGTDYIKLVADNTGNNGLSTPFPFDSNGDGIVDVIYAGDLKGKMWKFLVGPNDYDATVTSNTATWKVAFNGNPLFSAVDSLNNPQPITLPPIVSMHPSDGLMVLFGTGKYIEAADVGSTQQQTYYGIRDIGLAVSARASLATTTLQNALPRLLNSTAVPVAPQLDANNVPLDLGWYADLTLTRERLTGRGFLENRLIFFDTIVPDTDVCSGGVTSQIMCLKYETGAPLGSACFDTNNDGVVDQSDSAAVGISTGGALSGSTFIKNLVGAGYLGLSSQLQGNVTQFTINPGARARGRITWREILQ